MYLKPYQMSDPGALVAGGQLPTHVLAKTRPKGGGHCALNGVLHGHFLGIKMPH